MSSLISVSSEGIEFSMTEQEYERVSSWMEAHKDDPAVQHIIFLGHEIETGFQELIKLANPERPAV